MKIPMNFFWNGFNDSYLLTVFFCRNLAYRAQKFTLISTKTHSKYQIGIDRTMCVADLMIRITMMVTAVICILQSYLSHAVLSMAVRTQK